MAYVARRFDLPELPGLSREQLNVHLALYEGYVKHANLIDERIEALRSEDASGNAFLMNELRRRFGFEYDGMRMHEYYFEQLEGGTMDAPEGGRLRELARSTYKSWDGYLAALKEAAGTRGIGWVVTYLESGGTALRTCWVDDHQLGQLSGLPIILALDLWEHAYMVDYRPKDKMSYVDAFLANVNWSAVESRLS